MGATGDNLFPHLATEQVSPRTTGILPAQTIREFIDSGRIEASEQIVEEQIQPASIDLRLGEVAYRVRASFLPGEDCTVHHKLSEVLALSPELPVAHGLCFPAIVGNGRPLSRHVPVAPRIASGPGVTFCLTWPRRLLHSEVV